MVQGCGRLVAEKVESKTASYQMQYSGVVFVVEILVEYHGHDFWLPVFTVRLLGYELNETLRVKDPSSRINYGKSFETCIQRPLSFLAVDFR